MSENKIEQWTIKEEGRKDKVFFLIDLEDGGGDE